MAGRIIIGASMWTSRVKPQNASLVRERDRARLCARRAYGLARPDVLSRRCAVPAHYQDGAFIGQHGSWNRAELVGYKVVFVPFAQARLPARWKIF